MSTNVETVEDIDAQIEALNARKAVMLKASREADMEICIGLVKKQGLKRLLRKTKRKRLYPPKKSTLKIVK